MNMAIAFFSGCMTFVLMMVIKMPIKKVNQMVAGALCEEERERRFLYKRLNVSVMVVAVLVSMLCYYIVAELFMVSNIKWCCAMKGGAIAIALHALYSQLFEVPQDKSEQKEMQE